jgi:hypothetical protein
MKSSTPPSWSNKTGWRREPLLSSGRLLGCAAAADAKAKTRRSGSLHCFLIEVSTVHGWLYADFTVCYALESL